MTTLAQLKTQASVLLYDPDMVTFDSSTLGYFINAGIAQVSRVAPQKFLEDVDLVEGSLSYVIRGGTGNLLANPSFESGDETMFDSTYNVVSPGDEELTGGWSPSAASMRVLYGNSSNAKTGTHVGMLKPAAATASQYLYQNVPVNPGSTYFFQGWHWKGVAGGRANIIRVHTLDDEEVIVDTDALRHDTTSADPYFYTGSVSVPDDGTVAYIQVVLLAYNESLNGASEVFAFENISLSEENTSLVASNAMDAVEVRRVEVWTSRLDPAQRIARIEPARGDSESGWEWWDGRLLIPARWLARLDPTTDYLKVWGYAPYDKLVTETQVTDLSFELEQAVMEYVKMTALERLGAERDLFTQWQTRSGNSDISPASLMSQLAQARDAWRRTKRDIMVMREGH